jgi:hypothetical protein
LAYRNGRAAGQLVARHRRFLARELTGGEKAEVLLRLRDGDRSIPGSRVRRNGALVLADRAAAARLGGEERLET